MSVCGELWLRRAYLGESCGGVDSFSDPSVLKSPCTGASVIFRSFQKALCGWLVLCPSR